MKFRLLLVLLIGLVFIASPLTAADTPSGEVSLKFTTVALGMGHSKGEGTLTFKGKEYPFTAVGLSYGNVGISTVKYKGSVYNLKKVSDFSGKYFGGQVGLATGGGDAGLRVTNDKDVVLVLTGSTEGMEAKLGTKGLKIELK